MHKTIRRALKYLIVILLNLSILTILLALWTDDLELLLAPYCRPIEFLKILGLSALSSIAVGSYLLYLRKKNIPTSTKIRRAILLTVLLSSPLYIIYAEKIITNVFINGSFRSKLITKIRPHSELANGIKASGLTIQEYKLIASSLGLPPLPAASYNILCAYYYDGFLPDYSIELTYDVPSSLHVQVFDEKKDRWSRRQSVTIAGTTQRVTFIESRM